MRIRICVLLPLLFSACNGYYYGQPLCPASDPGLESPYLGSHSLRLAYGHDESQAAFGQLDIEPSSGGSLWVKIILRNGPETLNREGRAMICGISGQVFAESESPAGYSLSRLSPRAQGFAINEMEYDPAMLRARIPVLEGEGGFFGTNYWADDSGLSPEEFLARLFPREVTAIAE